VRLELYGMTETSPITTMNPYAGKRKLGSIGLPILNTDIKLVDTTTDREAPIGEAGEICIKGPQVMKGYHGKPEETRNVIDEEGFMHTGDVGVFDEEGYLKIVDRTKDMIIVGGFKVFSSKLEEDLSRHPAIDIVAAIGVPNPDRPGSEIVKVVMTINPDYTFDGNEKALEAEIMKFAKERCAPYEVPKIIEIRKELPLTAVGKVDKKVLRKESRQ
jgi:long-chain acyl-CoA synthetase